MHAIVKILPVNYNINGNSSSLPSPIIYAIQHSYPCSQSRTKLHEQKCQANFKAADQFSYRPKHSPIRLIKSVVSLHEKCQVNIHSHHMGHYRHPERFSTHKNLNINYRM